MTMMDKDTTVPTGSYQEVELDRNEHTVLGPDSELDLPDNGRCLPSSTSQLAPQDSQICIINVLQEDLSVAGFGTRSAGDTSRRSSEYENGRLGHQMGYLTVWES